MQIHRDHGATLKLEGSVVTHYWEGLRHFLLLTLYNFEILGERASSVMLDSFILAPY